MENWHLKIRERHKEFYADEFVLYNVIEVFMNKHKNNLASFEINKLEDNLLSFSAIIEKDWLIDDKEKKCKEFDADCAEMNIALGIFMCKHKDHITDARLKKRDDKSWFFYTIVDVNWFYYHTESLKLKPKN